MIIKLFTLVDHAKKETVHTSEVILRVGSGDVLKLTDHKKKRSLQECLGDEQRSEDSEMQPF